MSLTKTYFSMVNGGPISVVDFGAKGDNVTDDAAAIQAAIDYAYSLNKGVYFPSGCYIVRTGIVMKVGCESEPNTTIDALDSSIVTVTIPPGNYVGTYFNLPQIVRGDIGLLLDGVALSTIYFPSIALSTDGLVLQISNTNKTCADNVISFNTINGNSQASIKFNHLATAIAGTLFQGNQIKGNFITSSKYAVYFYDVNNGSLGANLSWDDTEVNVYAIDPANLAGSIGFYANANFPAGRCILTSKGFFDAMDDAYIKGHCSNVIFELSNSGQWDYTKFKQTGLYTITNFASNQGSYWGGLIPALTTTYDTLATFNGGVPLSANRNLLSFTLDTPMADGDTRSFYFYHMLMGQYSPKVTAEPLWEADMYVIACNECSTPGAPVPGAANPYPFQGIFRLRATGAVAAGTYYTAITVHNTPQ